MSDIKYVKIDDIDMSGPPRHATLPEELVERIKRFKEILKEVETIPLEQTLYNFRCDKNPQNEVAIWEDIAKHYEQQTLNHPELTLEAKKDIYRKVFVASSEEHPIRVVKKENTTEDQNIE